jgi:hypothetical protein
VDCVDTRIMRIDGGGGGDGRDERVKSYEESLGWVTLKEMK